uniref:Uncharacterized protein n=1 Tax=Solanum lycopersicum TaxID=4081 RepID=A0A3Q7I2H5_SOLLC
MEEQQVDEFCSRIQNLILHSQAQAEEKVVVKSRRLGPYNLPPSYNRDGRKGIGLGFDGGVEMMEETELEEGEAYNYDNYKKNDSTIDPDISPSWSHLRTPQEANKNSRQVSPNNMLPEFALLHPLH